MATESGQHSFIVGDTALDVTLPDHTGKLVQLASLWAEQPLIALFLRHFGCPHCREQVLHFQADQERLRELGYGIVLIGLGTPERAAAFRAELNIDFTVLCDPDRTAYKAYSLLRVNPFREVRPSTVTRYIGAMVMTRAPVISFDQDMIQLGGTFLIAPGGAIRYAHRAQRVSDNPIIADIQRDQEQAA